MGGDRRGGFCARGSGVVDFKIGRFDVDFGAGYGLTGGSDRWITKLIISTELNDPNIKNNKT
jgi:hypothetical protein